MCSDGYTALLRLLWAATGEGTHTPAMLTKSAPNSFTVTTPMGDAIHRFLSGTSRRLVDQLRAAAAHRPEYMHPALRRDREAALQFFAAGPQVVHARRLRHGSRGRLLDADTYRRLVIDEILPEIGQVTGAKLTQ